MPFSRPESLMTNLAENFGTLRLQSWFTIYFAKIEESQQLEWLMIYAYLDFSCLIVNKIPKWIAISKTLERLVTLKKKSSELIFILFYIFYVPWSLKKKKQNNVHSM
jgi:hypothetical protein